MTKLEMRHPLENPDLPFELRKHISVQEHRLLGPLLKAASKQMRHELKKRAKAPNAGLTHYAKTKEAIDELRSCFDEAWHVSVPCDRSHSPYYGDRQCSHCGEYQGEARGPHKLGDPVR